MGDRRTERGGQYGSIEVVIGPMKDGKSAVLINILEIREKHGKQTVQAFYPHVDNRGKPGTINSFDGKVERTFPATEIFSAREIKEKLKPGVNVVAIDEGQFVNDPDFAMVCIDLAMMGKEVIVAGLPTDFKKDTFGEMGSILAVADKITRIRNARCGVCGDEAKWTQRLVLEDDGSYRPAKRSEDVVVVGGTEDDARIKQEDQDEKPKNIYEPRCGDHHEVLEE